MKLVIVESPTKAKTIAKFLGAGFKIESSFGHIRDLPTSVLGVDVDNNFEPKYVVPSKAKATVAKLKALAKEADEIILASDEDREGEAISWHLSEALKIKPEDTKRIVFHEITKDAILKALEHPRHLDQNLVDAQQARRVLDRLVGYELSPFLWKKVAKGLSAGRVQSVAVRLVVERERAIQAFKEQIYFGIEALLAKKTGAEFMAELDQIDNEKLDKLAITDKTKAETIVKDLQGAEFKVSAVEKKSAKQKAPSPFKTSTLQQTANSRLGYSAKQTMMLAQRLYESGYITYMRTDSLNLSEKFLTEAHDYLKEAFGDKYCLAKPQLYTTKKVNAQEAHEAIRPTVASQTPDSLKAELDPRQYRLYKLIWQRSLAGQMPAAIFDNTKVAITAGRYTLAAEGKILTFDGYQKIYSEKNEDKTLPGLIAGEILDAKEIKSEQHATKPPARYSDATLVKELEKHDIGRPSTYAPTIATIETRNYVTRDDNKRLQPTDIAFVVNDLLVEHFPEVVDLKFTADMENDLDRIADGAKKWQPIIKEFYGPFHANLTAKYEEINKSDIVPEEATKEICDKCGSPMIIKTGRYGKFMACSNFPECKNIKKLNSVDKDGDGVSDNKEAEELSAKYATEVCPKCGSPMAVKVGRFGPFLACTAYPKCKSIKNIQENGLGSTGIKCPACGKGEIVAKRSRRGVFYACNNYPDCKTSFSGKPTGDPCPECGKLLIEVKDGVKCSNKECDYKK
jgi:DNA topoisomerase-1